MNRSALCALLFLGFSTLCQAAEPGNSSTLKNAKLEYLKTLQSAMAAATQEQNFAEVKRITEEINKVVAELDGLKAQPKTPPASAKEKMAEVEKAMPAHPFEEKPLAVKEEKKGGVSVNSSEAFAYEPPEVTTLAGSGKFNFADGAGPQALFAFPTGVAVDQSGNIFVADVGNHKIRKITPGGVVSTLAGSGKEGFADGTGSEAIFSQPNGLAIDEMGNIYIAEFSGNRIRKISPEGVVTTLAGSGKAGFADGTGVEATFNALEGIAVDSKGGVYVTDSKNHKIRKITQDGVVTTIAGSGKAGGADGAGAAASFNLPIGVAVDSGSNIYVCDTDNHKIRKITPNGVVTTIAGSGKAGAEDGNSSVASFNQPLGIAVDGMGNIYVTEDKNHKIRKITPNGFVSTLAGSGKAGAEDGYGTTASFNIPFGVAVDQFGTVYVSDAQNNKIRKIYQSGY